MPGTTTRHTALLDAVWAGHADIVQLLLASGAKVDDQHSKAGNTPLDYAVLTHRQAMVKLLLKAGARVDVRNTKGEMPLHIAAERGDPQIVDLLVAAHAPLEATDQSGDRPLDDAVLLGQPAIVTLLLAHGADAKHVRVLDGRGPLHEAAEKGFGQLIKPLIAAGGIQRNATATGRRRWMLHWLIRTRMSWRYCFRSAPI